VLKEFKEFAVKGNMVDMAVGIIVGAAAVPTTKECPHCLSTIPIQAKKCGHCTSDLKAA